MTLDRYNNLKEQCYICNISGATKKDCINCQKKTAIQQYEDQDNEQAPQYINVPIYGEEPDGCGEYQIIGYRKEYV